MFTYWKVPDELTWCDPPSSDLTDVSPKDFSSLANLLHCENSPVTGEMLLEYMVEHKRDAIFKSVSIEDVVRMAYDRFIRSSHDLSGDEYLRFDRAHCPPEQLEQLKKIVEFKDKLHVANYERGVTLCETAVFEICRRNDAGLLKIYLDEFNGYCPDEIYDTIFDYYIYMYLPEWDLLKQYNEKWGSIWELPGCLSYESAVVAPEVQQKMLDLLIRQAEKSGIAHPEVLKILLQHKVPSCRSSFPLGEQGVHLGMEFSNRDTIHTKYAGRILFHYDDKELSPTNCIDPWELDKLLADSTFALPVTCSCGDEGCGGIRAASESWVIGNKVRLYISDDSKMYFFDIPDRIALRNELWMMLKQTIRAIQYYKKLQKSGDIPSDDEDDETPFIPEMTCVNWLKDLCKTISEDKKRGI